MAKRLDLPMSDVDWLAFWAEFAQATDNKQLEVAERLSRVSLARAKVTRGQPPKRMAMKPWLR